MEKFQPKILTHQCKMFVMKISEGHSECFTKYHHANIYFFKANKGSKKAMCEIKVTDVALMSSCLC